LNPAYRRFVEAEIRRLGADHPVIQTQYLLESVPGAGRLFDESQLALIQGVHPRLRLPLPLGDGWGEASDLDDDDPLPIYVAGVDVAGESEQLPDALVRQRHPRKDSTVVTIARVIRQPPFDPRVEVVHHLCWTGRDHSTQYQALHDLLALQWRCQAICIDATGVGAGLASWLHKSIGARVEQVQFTRPLKSELGFELLAAVNAGRLKLYASDGSAESKECLRQLVHCRYATTDAAHLNFFLDPRDGHDDFVTSLALAVRASSRILPEPLSVMIPPRPDVWSSRY
jgi:hypothetical protein